MNLTCHDNDIRSHQVVFEKIHVTVVVYAGIVIAALAAPEAPAPDINVVEIDHFNGTGKPAPKPFRHCHEIG